MKLVYLIQGRDDPEQAVQLTNALSIDDYVVLTLNDSHWIDEAYYLFSKHRNVLLSTSTAFATKGDLSASRTWLYQLKEATEKFKFDYAINLTENIMPTVTRDELVAQLEKYDNSNIISINRDSDSSKELKKELSRYYLGTNSKDFVRKQKYRDRMKKYANFLYLIGFKRKLDFTVYEGEPWFALTYNTATTLGNELKFASQNFILSWYSERFMIQTMWKMFVPHQETINDYLVSEDVDNPLNKPFKMLSDTIERKEIAELLKHYNNKYQAPYDYIAEEIEEVKKGMLDNFITYIKNKLKK
jgi:hypothetical protein